MSHIDFPTARSKYPKTGSWSHVETMARTYWHRAGKGNGFPTETTDTTRAFVRVDYARWIVDCPGPRCGQAQYADPDDQRFLCVGCWNGFADGKWVPVVWPDDPPTVEGLLKPRPEEHTRAWRPGESHEQLRSENRALVRADLKGMPNEGAF